MGILRHLHRVFAVEPAYKGIGQPEHRSVQHRRQHQHGAAAQQQQLPRSGVVVLTIAAAHQRLCALRHTVEDGGSHQRKVCHHAVGCYAHVARQTQQQKVEHRGGHAGGKLTHKAGDAQLTALPQQPCRGHLPHELQGVLLFKEVAAANGDADNGRHRRCQRRTGQAQPQGEHKDIVEHHVEQTAAQGRYHGKGGVAVVADKGRNDVVAHKKRGEQQKDAGVGDAQCHDTRIAAHEPQQRPGRKGTRQHPRDGRQHGAQDGVGKIPLSPGIVLRLGNGVAGGRAQRDHGANGKNKVVDGQAEVEQSNAVCTGGLRNKIGIGQNIARGAQQTKNILRDIFKELFCQIHTFFPFPVVAYVWKL